MVNADDLKLFDFADDAEEAWQNLIRRGLKAHAPAPMAAGEPAATGGIALKTRKLPL